MTEKKYNERVSDCSKAYEVVNSCETVAQLHVAESYVNQFMLKHGLHRISRDHPDWPYVNVLRLLIRAKFKALT